MTDIAIVSIRMYVWLKFNICSIDIGGLKASIFADRICKFIPGDCKLLVSVFFLFYIDDIRIHILFTICSIGNVLKKQTPDLRGIGFAISLQPDFVKNFSV